MKSQHLKDRVLRYLNLLGHGVKITGFLGDGTDGAVWATDQNSAIKAFNYDFGYFNERDAYARLADFGVTEQIAGFWIPKMLGCHDDLMVVEMDLMQQPPYIIDFAKVRFDRPPDFSEETLLQYEQQGLERFERRWPTVKLLMGALESFQIYYLDPQPNNIVFPTE
ncbi:MAG TPA: hypothetical protein VHC19_06480 [Pirellulales bacterium]|jgi:hypothetical protein|nr:hypothetical protein [Pirellulales bacterium]